jgi:hypothetical protein
MLRGGNGGWFSEYVNFNGGTWIHDDGGIAERGGQWPVFLMSLPWSRCVPALGSAALGRGFGIASGGQFVCSE